MFVCMKIHKKLKLFVTQKGMIHKKNMTITTNISHLIFLSRSISISLSHSQKNEVGRKKPSHVAFLSFKSLSLSRTPSSVELIITLHVHPPDRRKKKVMLVHSSVQTKMTRILSSKSLSSIGHNRIMLIQLYVFFSLFQMSACVCVCIKTTITASAVTTTAAAAAAAVNATVKMNIKFSTNLHASKMRSIHKLNQDILWHRKRLTACMMNFAICFVSITNYLTN